MDNTAKSARFAKLRMRNYREKVEKAGKRKENSNDIVDEENKCLSSLSDDESTRIQLNPAGNPAGFPSWIFLTECSKVKKIMKKTSELQSNEEAVVIKNKVNNESSNNEYVLNSLNIASVCCTDEENIDSNENDRFSSSDDSDFVDSDDDEKSFMGTSEEQLSESSITQDLRKWARNSNIPYVKIDSLLKVLKPYHPELPASHKTLFKLNIEKIFKVEKFNPSNFDDGEFMYCGIENQLQIIVNRALHKDNILNLQFGIDGLPLYKSSSKEFWPILGKIHRKENVYKPFTIAVYSGIGKPKSVELFLSRFVGELNSLLSNGIEIKGTHFKISIMCFVCDRPARSFIKCIKGHTGYYACERCMVKGYRLQNRTIFPLDGSMKRTDDSFRTQINKEHHLGISPLTEINPPIDMIGLFVLDFIDLCCLGVTKKLLIDYWTKPGSSHKLKREEILRISQRLVNLSSQIPDEFQRTIRSLGEINKWKATEYRIFLMYTGMFALKGILSEKSTNISYCLPFLCVFYQVMIY